MNEMEVEDDKAGDDAFLNDLEMDIDVDMEKTNDVSDLEAVRCC